MSNKSLASQSSLIPKALEEVLKRIKHNQKMIKVRFTIIIFSRFLFLNNIYFLYYNNYYYFCFGVEVDYKIISRKKVFFETSPSVKRSFTGRNLLSSLTWFLNIIKCMSVNYILWTFLLHDGIALFNTNLYVCSC